VTRIKIRIRANHLTRSSTADHTFQSLAEEVLGTHLNLEDRSCLISLINRLIGTSEGRGKFQQALFSGFDISEDLSERILSAVSPSNAAQFIEQLHLAHNNMFLQVARPSLASSELTAGGVSGPSRIQGTPFGRPSTSSAETASGAAVAVTRSGDPDMPRVRPGVNDQDANANPPLTRPNANRNLVAAGAAAADQSQAGIDVAVNEAAGPGAAAAAKSESDNDPAPTNPRKRKPDEDDDRKPPAK
jgi:hypothetical protein